MKYAWQAKINRRNAIRVGTGGILGLGSLASVGAKMVPERRLAIIGGGMGGIASAYFCDSAWSIDLFEARDKIGGNADTVAVQDGDRTISVDLGAEFFNAETHPIYWALLEEIGGITEPKKPTDIRIEVPATLSIFDFASQKSLFSSQHPLASLLHAISFAIYSQNARSFLDHNPSYEVTIQDWVDGLWLANDFKKNVLLPWFASLTAGTLANLSRSSLLSTLLLFAKTFPENIFKKPRTFNSTIGLEGLLHLLAGMCENLSIHTGSKVTKLSRHEGQWYVETDRQRFGPYEKVIVNAPPHASVNFLRNSPAEMLALLRRQEYFRARIVIHTDPIYMPRDPKHWATQNAAVDGEFCEASIWIGSTREHVDGGKRINLFKSWATHRSVESKEIIAERTFLHPVDTPDMLAAIKELGDWQGRDGLYFTGHFTTLTDLQETALFSSMQVAKAIDPSSARLGALEKRLRDIGKDTIDYSVP